MSKGRTIALNLYDDHIQVLDRLAKRQGSRSAAVQKLLEEAKRKESYRELDEAYREYLGLAAGQADRELTEDLLRAASWPEEWLGGVQGAGRSGRRKGRKAR